MFVNCSNFSIMRMESVSFLSSIMHNYRLTRLSWCSSHNAVMLLLAAFCFWSFYKWATASSPRFSGTTHWRRPVSGYIRWTFNPGICRFVTLPPLQIDWYLFIFADMGTVLSQLFNVIIQRLLPLVIIAAPVNYALIFLAQPHLAYYVVCTIGVLLAISSIISRREQDMTMFKLTSG